MKIGYVSSDADLNMQLSALSRHGCDEVIRDDYSSLLAKVASSDSLVIWRIDKLGRTVADVRERVSELLDAGVSIISLHDGINTHDQDTELLQQVLAALSDIEQR